MNEREKERVHLVAPRTVKRVLPRQTRRGKAKHTKSTIDSALPTFTFTSFNTVEDILEPR